jgi:putative transposase
MNSHILPFAELGAKIRLFFMDEATFGRISEPSKCWAPNGIRPIVPCQMVREYMHVYGAVEPLTGEKFFIIAPKCNTEWTNAFLAELSKKYANDYILLPMDNASWHKSKTLTLPDNIRPFYLPPRTPEMNPIEQLWPEVRHDFKNKLFNSIDLVVQQLCISLNSLSRDTVKSVTDREWILQMI